MFFNGKDCVKVIDLDQWINLSISENDAEKINGKEILTLNHILLCKQEGVIIPVTSGQDDSDAKLNALAALRERYYLRIARAVRRLSRGNGELLGHIIGVIQLILIQEILYFRKRICKYGDKCHCFLNILISPCLATQA